jgi:hypothetical protein
VPCRAVPCDTVPCRAVPCDAVPCRAVPCDAVPCRAVRCGAVRCSAVPRGCERSQGKKRAVVSGGRVRPGGRLMLAEAGCGAGRGELRQSVGRAEASEEKV